MAKAAASQSALAKTVDGSAVKKHLRTMIETATGEYIGLASPFIKEKVVKDVLDEFKKRPPSKHQTELRILVTLDFINFVTESSDKSAIDLILKFIAANPDRKVVLRQLLRLHSKIYVSSNSAIVGSANLTNAGLGGGNFENAILLKRKADREMAAGEFEKLWMQARTVTERYWRNTAKRIAALKSFAKEFRKIREEVFAAGIALERIPDTGNQANYYSNLLECLQWIQEDPKKSRANRPLINHLRQLRSDEKTSLAEAERRRDFLKELKLISFRKDRWHVTELGKKLSDDLDSRWRLFAMLLTWCDERGDEQFRVLLKCIEDNTNTKNPAISLNDLYGKINPEDRKRWWPYAQTDDYNKFVSNSCQARNWLVSLGVLERERHGKSFCYSPGPLYAHISPRGTKRMPLDARLNFVIESTPETA